MTAKQVQATNQILEHVYRAHDALVDLRRHGSSVEGVLMKPAFQISALKAAREELSGDRNHRAHGVGAQRMTSESDIVERLRQQPSSDREQEAADEIERLRAALVIARKYARTDADAASIAWAEGTITYMRKLLEQQAVKIQRHNDEIKRLRVANERLRKALEESTLYLKRLATEARANTGQDGDAE
jgi:hypothetical protein